MSKVVVIGGDHHNTLGVIRGLGEREVYPDLALVTSSKMSFVDASKYISRKWKVKGDDEIVDLLISQYRDEKEKTVVICCSDTSSGVIDDNKDKLTPYFILPGAEKQGKISSPCGSVAVIRNTSPSPFGLSIQLLSLGLMSGEGIVPWLTMLSFDSPIEGMLRY